MSSKVNKNTQTTKQSNKQTRNNQKPQTTKQETIKHSWLFPFNFYLNQPETSNKKQINQTRNTQTSNKKQSNKKQETTKQSNNQSISTLPFLQYIYNCWSEQGRGVA